MKLSEMPVVTVEQIMRFRQAAMAVKQQNASLLQEFNNVCNQRDQLEAQNAELLAALKTIQRGGITGADMMQIASEAIAKAGA